MELATITRERCQRLTEERARQDANLTELFRTAEEDNERDLNDLEIEQRDKIRKRMAALDDEIGVLADELERAEKSRDVSALLRTSQTVQQAPSVQINDGPVVYRTFAQYALDKLVADYPTLARKVHGPEQEVAVRTAAAERLMRVEHTLTSDVAGLLPPQHMAQLLDIINTNRPVVATARRVDLERGQLTYPEIVQRPEVLKQGTEKTEAGTANMQITLGQMNADTYLGGGNLSWQTINWSTPNALQLWFDLAAEAYARQTETRACTVLQTTAGGTASIALGTSGTEDFTAWTRAAFSGIGGIYTNTGGRARTNTLYLSASRFFQLAGIGSANTVQVTEVGNLDVSTMTGTWRGLRVVGSYGFSNANTAIVGDSAAFLVGETPGAPVEMRAVEPAIGGMEVGVIGAFQAKVFDGDRFIHLT